MTFVSPVSPAKALGQGLSEIITQAGIWTPRAKQVVIGPSEIMSCIQLCELKMRTIELPALRSDPYGGTPAVLLTDSQGMANIPADMNKPILFFQETPNSEVEPGTIAASMGPWIIYDRVGDREIIRRRMIDQLYVRPFGVPRVIRASFSEVGQKYVFTPNPGENVSIKAYYQKTFPFLFGPTGDTLEPIVQNNAALASFPEGYTIDETFLDERQKIDALKIIDDIERDKYDLSLDFQLYGAMAFEVIWSLDFSRVVEVKRLCCRS